MCVDVCVIHMLVVFTDFINVIPFQGIEMFSFPSRCYNIIESAMVPYVCLVFSVWIAYPELLLLLLLYLEEINFAYMMFTSL
jgi:hypothetical protein